VPREIEMTHEFMYPKVAPAPDTGPEADSRGPAGSAGTHNDTAGGAPSGAHEERRSGPPVARDGPLRSDHPEGTADERR
jgi:hypothetical protein